MYAKMDSKPIKTPVNKLSGERLQDLLDTRGITQADLAQAMGRQRSVVNEVIKGRRNIGLRLGKDMAKALDRWNTNQPL